MKQGSKLPRARLYLRTPAQDDLVTGMRIVCGLLGAGVGILAIKAIPAPNLNLTSYANGYDVLTGAPHLAWRGWVVIAAILLGFLICSALYRRSSPSAQAPQQSTNLEPPE